MPQMEIMFLEEMVKLLGEIEMKPMRIYARKGREMLKDVRRMMMERLHLRKLGRNYVTTLFPLQQKWK